MSLKQGRCLLRHKSAFSLIEVVVVIVVVGIMSLGLAVAIQQAMSNIHKPETVSIATALAVSEAERVVVSDFSNVVDQNRDSPVSYTGNFSNYSWQVRVDSIDTAQPNLGSDPGMGTYKMVEVRVHHPVINYIKIIFLKTNYSQ